jgi:alpha-ketoglutarate-dependent taurine dioxygenase
MAKKNEKKNEPLERMADSLEQLVEQNKEPLIQIETVPPRCPHCGQINPELTLEAESGRGKSTEFILEGYCAHCNKPVFGVANQWVLCPNVTEAKVGIANVNMEMDNG